LLEEAIAALGSLVANLQDSGDDHNPETGEEYDSVAEARRVLRKLRNRPEPKKEHPRVFYGFGTNGSRDDSDPIHRKRKGEA